MKTIFCTATSLNGFIADANNSLDWLFQFGEPDPSFQKFVDGVGVIAMGSTTYEWLLDHHVFSPAGNNPWPYKIPVFVFTSRNLRKLENDNITFVKGDVRPVHEKMKSLTNKNIWVMGGGELAAKFYDQDLLDEIIVHLASVTLSGGAPLFPRNIQTPMKVLGIREMQPGLIEIHYQVKG